MLIALLITLCATAFIGQRVLSANTQQEVLNNAKLLMTAAESIRTHTNLKLMPLIFGRKDEKFVPDLLPSVNTSRILDEINETFENYHYSQVAINPTNLNNKASDWQADIINYFRQNPDSDSYVLMRKPTSQSESLVLAKPIKVEDTRCLICHSNPEFAPQSMLDIYGKENGFGWEIDEIVGIAMVNIPTNIPRSKANSAFYTFMLISLLLVLSIWILLNILLHFVVIKPVKLMAESADKISTGDFSAPEFSSNSKDEISSLGKSFNRMYRSLKSAIRLLDKQP